MVDVSALGSAISIHAPRGGSDSVGVMVYGRTTEFLSTLPVGGATLLSDELRTALTISIHAPRGGSDEDSGARRILTDGISIHAPRGGSDEVSMANPLFNALFLSTLPVGGATANMIIFHSYLQQFIMQSDNFF